MNDRLLPPVIRPVVVPSSGPSKVPISYNELLGKPSISDRIEIDAKGSKPLLILNHTETAPPAPAHFYFYIQFRRDKAPKVNLALDEHDHLVFVAADGTTAIATIAPGLPLTLNTTTAGAGVLLELAQSGGTIASLGVAADGKLVVLDSDGSTMLTIAADKTKAENAFQADAYLDHNAHQVVGLQQSAIVDAAATTGSPGGSDSAGGLSTDPATLGDVDGAYGATNALQAHVTDLQGTVATLLSTVNALLGVMRTHGLIAT